MPTPDPFATIDATAAVPIDLASKMTLGAIDLGNRALAEWHERGRRLRYEWARLRLWADNAHLTPEQVLQLVALVLYAITAVADAVARKRGTST